MTYTLKNIDKHMKDLHKEVEELEQFKEIYQKVIPEIKTLLDELFEKDNIKALTDYTALKRDYHDRIFEFFNPKNFTQLVIEATLPGIYDAPGERMKKISAITKLTKDLKNTSEEKGKEKGNETTKKPKITAKKIQQTSVGDKNTVEEEDVDFPIMNLQTWGQVKDVLQSSDDDNQDSKKILPNNLIAGQNNAIALNVEEAKTDIEKPQPDLMYVQIGSHKHIYNPENAKIYKASGSEAVPIGEVSNGKIVIDNKSYSLRVEKVIELKDPETDQFFYKSIDGTYYEKINEVDGWLVGLDDEQKSRLVVN